MAQRLGHRQQHPPAGQQRRRRQRHAAFHLPSAQAYQQLAPALALGPLQARHLPDHHAGHARHHQPLGDRLRRLLPPRLHLPPGPLEQLAKSSRPANASSTAGPPEPLPPRPAGWSADAIAPTASPRRRGPGSSPAAMAGACPAAAAADRRGCGSPAASGRPRPRPPSGWRGGRRRRRQGGQGNRVVGEEAPGALGAGEGGGEARQGSWSGGERRRAAEVLVHELDVAALESRFECWHREVILSMYAAALV